MSVYRFVFDARQWCSNWGKEPSFLPAPRMAHLVAPLLIEFDLMFLFDTKPAHYGQAILVEQKKCASIGFGESLHHCRNGR